MSYNDNDTYGSSGRQGASAAYGDDRGERLDRDTGLGGDSYSSGGGALGSDSYGSDNRGLADKARDKLSGNRTDRPDDPISGTNYDQSSTGRNTGYGDKSSSSYGGAGNDNRGLADQARDKLSSDRTDRPDDPISGTNYDQSSTGHNTGYGDKSSSSYGGAGNDNRGLADKARDKLSSDRTDRPDDPISGTNYDQSSTGRNTGYGDTTSSSYGTSGTTGSGYGENTSSNYSGDIGQDNRSFTEKAKDKVSSKRSDQPDDPISGKNYGEDSGRGSYGSSGNDDNNSSSKPSLMEKIKDKVGLNKDKNDGSGSYGGSDTHGSSERSDNY